MLSNKHNLTERHSKILNVLYVERGLRSSEISSELNIPERTLMRYLKELLDLDFVKVEGKGPNTQWFKL